MELSFRPKFIQNIVDIGPDPRIGLKFEVRNSKIQDERQDDEDEQLLEVICEVKKI